MAPRPKQATPRPAPRLYLTTPQLADSAAFPAQLSTALEAGDVAAVLARLAEADERTLINRAKMLTGPVQDQGVALLLDGHVGLVARSGADGAHATGIAEFGEALEQLKPDRIVGIGGLASRHDAMLAAERGADYVMFGEPEASGARPGFAAIEERIGWWAEVFEIPCVGYAAAIDEIAPLVTAGADFVALGDFLWRDPREITATMGEAMRQLMLHEPAA